VRSGEGGWQHITEKHTQQAHTLIVPSRLTINEIVESSTWNHARLWKFQLKCFEIVNLILLPFTKYLYCLYLLVNFRSCSFVMSMKKCSGFLLDLCAMNCMAWCCDLYVILCCVKSILVVDLPVDSLALLYKEVVHYLRLLMYESIDWCY
jgi:hypothetical protein